jgi:outer membrane receptor protein involved in Fe transport
MTNMILPKRLTGALGGGLVAVTLSPAVTGIQAQEAMSMASADIQLEEVIVTARRRAENILEVPMSISAISEVEMQKRNIQFVGDLFRKLPGGASPGGNLILRGLSGGDDETAPGTTTTFTDDIPYDFAYMSDIDRVEVLRGPQGTLYGSNAIGGTIRIIFNKPKLDEWELFGTVNYSREGSVAMPDTDLSLGINIPFIENRMAMRINHACWAL